jgi:hypothetical protein
MKNAFTFYSEALRIAWHSITSHKLRAFLTLIGIIIGVASVILVGASISGLNTYVIDRVGRVLGANHFMMARMANSSERGGVGKTDSKKQAADLGRLRVGPRQLRTVQRSRGRGEPRNRSQAQRRRTFRHGNQRRHRQYG